MVVFRVGLDRFWNWITEGVLLSPWRHLPELLFSHLFRSVDKEFWDEICLGCINRCEETLVTFRIWENRDSWEWRSVAQLLSWWNYCISYCLQVCSRLIREFFLWKFPEAFSSMSGSLGKNIIIFGVGENRGSWRRSYCTAVLENFYERVLLWNFYEIFLSVEVNF